MTKSELFDFLECKAAYYENPKFLETDPVQIPNRFTKKEDIEIAGFLAATIAWGNRKSIITNANKLLEIMEHQPHSFVLQYQTPQELHPFVHRTFNAIDLAYFFRALRRLYIEYPDMESFFRQAIGTDSLQTAIHQFKNYFFRDPFPARTQKHISDPLKNSAAKRINMFLRWMVRSSAKGVDLGVWNTIAPGQLSCPLDVHSGNVARYLGLLKRRQNDAKAVAELDQSLRKYDSDDPVKYDFALFGLGVFEKFGTSK